ncbi:MAG: sugar phosphate isomerase/epimerase family protein [Bryobacteraceae bacterium]
MKFGVNTFLWTANFDRSHLPILPRIKEWGFDGVEFATFNFDEFPAAEAKKMLSDLGLGCTICTALIGTQSLVTEDAAVRKSTREFLLRAIEGTAAVGADALAGPFCSAVGYLPGRRRTEDEWKRAVEGLQSLGHALQSHNVTLAVEPLNRFETFFLNTAADSAKLCDEVNHPNIGILFDTFHANIEEKNLATGLAGVGRHLRHVHSCENDRGTPGSGHVEWPVLFDTLRRQNYNAWLVIESFGFSIKEIAAAACIWRDLASSPDALAADGVKFLREMAVKSAKGAGRTSKRAEE